MRLLNDVAWLMFVGGFSPPLVQSLCVGLAVLRDARPKPILTRWVGYFNLWCVTLFIPGGIVLLVESGPFAWNGLMAFWVPACIFGAWYFVMFFALRRAIREEEISSSAVGVET